jgi:hypothetical protein
MKIKINHKEDGLLEATGIKSEKKLKKHVSNAIDKRMRLEIDEVPMDLTEKEKLSLVMMSIQVLDAETMAGLIYNARSSSEVIEALYENLTKKQFEKLSVAVLNWTVKSYDNNGN